MIDIKKLIDEEGPIRKFELMNKARAIPLTHNSRREIRTLFQKHPFSHEI